MPKSSAQISGAGEENYGLEVCSESLSAFREYS